MDTVVDRPASGTTASTPPAPHEVLGNAMLRKLERSGRLRHYTMKEVAKHNRKEDGWIVVDGKVFDITHHILNHPGWECGCALSQVLAIMRTLGTDCTQEVLMVHSQRALQQIQPFLIGLLVDEEERVDRPASLGSVDWEKGSSDQPSFTAQQLSSSWRGAEYGLAAAAGCPHALRAIKRREG